MSSFLVAGVPARWPLGQEASIETVDHESIVAAPAAGEVDVGSELEAA